MILQCDGKLRRYGRGSGAAVAMLTVVGGLILLPIRSAGAAALTGVTSRPAYSVFVEGEPVELNFAAEGLRPGEAGRTANVTVADADGRVLLRTKLPVTADAAGKWKASIPGPHNRLGYYNVSARLSTGEELPALGSRSTGYFTYLVVVDPRKRVQVGEDARFGMQGGFTTAFDARPYLGVHWVLGDYSWKENEPDHAGQFAEKRKLAAQKPDPAAAAEKKTDKKWDIINMPTLLNGTPVWALVGGKNVYTTGVIKDIAAWKAYCSEVGQAALEDEPDLKRHVFQITWEPVYPWGFPGTPKDLVRDYEVAYPALHAADPKAFVIGPTGGGISAGDLAWNESLFKLGLGRYLDGFSIHPYIGEPPEAHHLVENIRALREMIRAYAGRDLPLFGTEQGWATGGDPSKEWDQAAWLTRSYLIMLGEGFQVNMAFYFADYPTEPGFGFFYNLNAKIPWGTDAVSPKPVAGAFSALTYLIEGHQTVGPIEWLGPDTLGYAFQRGREVTLALWEYGDTRRTVHLPVGTGAVKVFDWMGNPRTLAAPGGTLTLTLGPTPQYIRGVSPSLWGKGASRPLSVSPPYLSVFPGERARFTARVAPTTGKSWIRVTPSADLKSPALRIPIRLRPGQPIMVPIRLTVPAAVPPGAYPVQLTLERSSGLAGLAPVMVRVLTPISVVSVRPGEDRSLRITIQNQKHTIVQGEMHIRLHGVPSGRRTVAFDLAPAGMATTVVRFAGVPLISTRVYEADISLLEKSGETIAGIYRATFLAAPHLQHPPAIDGDLADWADVPSIDISGRGHVVRQPQLYHGATDLAANLQYGWDDRALYFAARVTDDRFVQEKEGFDTWQQDSIQLAFDTQPGRASAGTGNLVAEAGEQRQSEINLALTTRGPQAYRSISPNTATLPVALIPAAELPLAIVRKGSETLYECAIPWATLGLKAPPHEDEVLGVAATVNDVDSPNQPDPKALGLFGGITPVKDPDQFGEMLLSDRAPADFQVRPASTVTLRTIGFLAQTESAPIPWTGCTGVAVDATGRVWTMAGDAAYVFRAGTLLERDRLPVAMQMARSDGRRVVCLGTDHKLYAFDLKNALTTPLANAPLPDGKGPIDMALGPAGDIYTLGSDGTVNHWTAAGKSTGIVFRAKPGHGWAYISIGVDPATGDLLLGSDWRDRRIYRFSRDGTPINIEEAPGSFAQMILPIHHRIWSFNIDGEPSPPGLGRDAKSPYPAMWAYYPTGAAADPAGGIWIACAQGLLHVDSRGETRVGGLADPGLVALGPDGTALALVENGGWVTRCYADDLPNDPLSCDANEPWRVGAGWTGRAAGIAWDGVGYLVLDSVARRLWQFDSEHTAWGEQTWTPLTKEGTFNNPRALAVDDARIFVLDGNSLLSLPFGQPDTPGAPVPLPSDIDPAAITAIAAGEGIIYLATAREVISLDENGKELWTTGPVFSQITGLAACKRGVLAADRGSHRVTLLYAKNGSSIYVLEQPAVPGGFEPAGIAAAGPWVLIADTTGHRLVLVRIT